MALKSPLILQETVSRALIIKSFFALKALNAVSAWH